MTESKRKRKINRNIKQWTRLAPLLRIIPRYARYDTGMQITHWNPQSAPINFFQIKPLTIQKQIKSTETQTLTNRSKTDNILSHPLIHHLPSCTSSPAVLSPKTCENFQSSGAGGPAAADATSPSPPPPSIFLRHSGNQNKTNSNIKRNLRKQQLILPFPFLFSLHWKRIRFRFRNQTKIGALTECWIQIRTFFAGVCTYKYNID